MWEVSQQLHQWVVFIQSGTAPAEKEMRDTADRPAAWLGEIMTVQGMKLVCTGQVIVVQSGMQLCEPFHVGYKNVAIWFFHFIPEIEHFFFLNLREWGNSFSPTGRALIQFPSTPEEGWTWEPLQPLPCNDNFLFCGCDKLLYQTPTSPALPSLPRKLWEAQHTQVTLLRSRDCMTATANRKE